MKAKEHPHNNIIPLNTLLQAIKKTFGDTYTPKERYRIDSNNNIHPLNKEAYNTCMHQESIGTCIEVHTTTSDTQLTISFKPITPPSTTYSQELIDSLRKRLERRHLTITGRL